MRYLKIISVPFLTALPFFSPACATQKTGDLTDPMVERLNRRNQRFVEKLRNTGEKNHKKALFWYNALQLPLLFSQAPFNIDFEEENVVGVPHYLYTRHPHQLLPFYISWLSYHIDFYKRLGQKKLYKPEKRKSKKRKLPLSLRHTRQNLPKQTSQNEDEQGIEDLKSNLSFHFACFSGNIPMVQSTLYQYTQNDNLAAIDQGDIEKMTPLHWAASSQERGAEEIINLLIDHGASLDAMDHTKMRLIYFACCLNNTAAVKQLIDSGSEIHQKLQNSYSLLQVAGNAGSAQVIKVLVDAGVKSPHHSFLRQAIFGDNIKSTYKTIYELSLLNSVPYFLEQSILSYLEKLPQILGREITKTKKYQLLLMKIKEVNAQFKKEGFKPYVCLKSEEASIFSLLLTEQLKVIKEKMMQLDKELSPHFQGALLQKYLKEEAKERAANPIFFRSNGKLRFTQGDLQALLDEEGVMLDLFISHGLTFTSIKERYLITSSSFERYKVLSYWVHASNIHFPFELSNIVMNFSIPRVADTQFSKKWEQTAMPLLFISPASPCLIM
ncbi:MAG: ankyrin repeat domain-containing protein [Bacteroidota bacterium]